MLISPPFLPPRGTQTEEQWLNTAMAGGQPGHGAFPASYMLEWHGGMHLTAPMGGNGVALPVRAIADGTVVFVRQRTSADSPEEPLNYGDGYTSDAVVVIRHDTEIGANAAGQATQVRFYSLYMHLHSIQPTVMVGRPIYRKDEIGQAGHIYGEPNVMHFEICCDDANLGRLVGRATGNLSLAADGRTDVLFGEMYFHLPVGTSIYGAKPLPQFTQAMMQPATAPARRGQPANPPPAPVALQAVHTTSREFVIGLRYAGGEGSAGQRGDALLTTYRMTGEVEGVQQREAEAEYKLYTSAKKISEAYPAAARPIPSAVYELLRFGRVVGPDALAPANVPHWREVSYPGGQGWVNLNASNVHKYSDADFPHWRGWALIDDDTNGDSRCDSAKLRDTIYDNGVSCLQPSKQHATAQLNSTVVQGKLARSVCKFPSEWDASTVDKRWSWLKTRSDENPEPLTEDDYTSLKAHVQALCFPLPELFSAKWRFNPRKFIEHFRLCGWLSANEMAQSFPRSVLHLRQRQFHASSTTWAVALGRAQRWCTAFNRATRRYGVSSSKYRLIHFFAHVIPETGNLGLVKEIQGETQSYSPYYGRGLIQLTHLDNYQSYGQFRGFQTSNPSNTFPALGWSPDDLIARDNNGNHNSDNCADSACFYVAKRQNMLSHLDNGVSQADAIVASKDVNGYVAIENLNGLDVRLQSVAYLSTTFLDEVPAGNSVPITFTWRRNSQKEPVFDAQGNPVMVGRPPHQKKQFFPVQHVINASLQRQRP